ETARPAAWLPGAVGAGVADRGDHRVPVADAEPDRADVAAVPGVDGARRAHLLRLQQAALGARALPGLRAGVRTGIGAHPHRRLTSGVTRAEEDEGTKGAPGPSPRWVEFGPPRPSVVVAVGRGRTLWWAVFGVPHARDSFHRRGGRGGRPGARGAGGHRRRGAGGAGRGRGRPHPSRRAPFGCETRRPGGPQGR